MVAASMELPPVTLISSQASFLLMLVAAISNGQSVNADSKSLKLSFQPPTEGAI